MTLTFDPIQLVSVAVVVVAVIARVWKRVRDTDRILRAVSSLIHRELDTENPRSTATTVRRELNPNGGRSMKDDLTGVTVAVAILGRWFDQLRKDFDDHLTDSTTREQQIRELIDSHHPKVTEDDPR